MRKAVLALALAAVVLTGSAATHGAAGKDKTAPTIPQNLKATPVSPTRIDLTWSPSTDNVGVAGYRVYRGGILFGTSAGPSYSATGLSPSTNYTFTVTAYDAAGNVSKKSNYASARTAGDPPPPPPPPTSERLLAKTDLAYQGAFLLPESPTDSTSFSYGGTALAYNPASNSLFAVGHDWYQLSAEVSIPALVNSANLGSLNHAGFRQQFRDATNGKVDQAGGDNNKIGGQLVYQGRLYGSVYVYYDAAGEQAVSHWSRPSTSLTTGTAAGLYELAGPGAGMVSGYMGEVATEWRTLLGGPAFTGNCCIPIISRTSFGPALFSFDPATLGGANPVPDSALLYYPQAHPTIGNWDQNWNPANGVLFNGNSTVRGVVFPSGTRSVLFFGTQGIGKFCYGEGTDDPSLDGKPTPDGTIYCYDPDDSYKGTHGYPYVTEVWAYDANDFLAVKKGRKQPWDVKPYATWTLTLPFNSGRVGGAAYDPVHRLIYVSQQYGNGADPVIHAFKVAD